MKFRINSGLVVLTSIVFSLLLLLNSCNNDDGKCCEGFTGKVTDPKAESLLKICHFIDEKTIEDWVGRYNEFKSRIDREAGYKTNENDTANAKIIAMKVEMEKMSTEFLKGGSVSYNSCIIKKILCHKNSIGLRVLYGISKDNKMHIILVGINPDYSNLYVEGEDCCDKSLNKTAGAGLTSTTDAKGGAEYGQMP